MSATIVFGVKMKSTDLYDKVTKYDENTGKPYTKKVTVMTIDFVVCGGEKFKLPDYWTEDEKFTKSNLEQTSDEYDFDIFGLKSNYFDDNCELPFYDHIKLKDMFRKECEKVGFFTESQIESIANSAKLYIIT